MAELENAAWKDDRRFRIVSVDGGVLSFLDLFMHTPSKPPSSAGPPSPHMHEDDGKNISITGAGAPLISYFSIVPSEKHILPCHEGKPVKGQHFNIEQVTAALSSLLQSTGVLHM